MNRRDTVVALLALGAAPLASIAQQLARVARIGFLGSASASGSASSVDALKSGLRDLGYIGNRDIVIEFRWAEGKYERLAELATELVRLNVDVLVTYGTPGIRAPLVSGLKRTATFWARGTASLSNSRRFAVISGPKMVNPVTFPSGRARLPTRPVATASALAAITMGIAVVALLAARIPGVP